MITGHRGYLGSALYQRLSEIIEIEVVGYDIVENNDILDYANLLRFMKQHQPDIVIHLAALTSNIFCSQNPKRAIDINACGTRNILKAMDVIGCKYIIYGSSSSVYENNNKLPYSETQLPTPSSPYSFSKLLGEYAVNSHYDFSKRDGGYLIFRFFEVIGRSVSRCDSLMGKLLSGEIVICGNDYPTFDGTYERDYISVDDACEAMMQGISLLLCESEIRETVNICSGDPISIKSIVYSWNNLVKKMEISKLFDTKPIPYVKILYKPKHNNVPGLLFGTNNKAKKLINWIPQQKIDNIIYDLATIKNGRSSF